MDQIGIGMVERETGVSRDVLRMWERRYRFPLPRRDRLGERVYTLQHVNKLRLIKLLMAHGHRAGSVVNRPASELAAMLKKIAAPSERAQPAAGLLDAVRAGKADKLRAALERRLATLGMQQFLEEVLAPLNVAIGSAWVAGDLSIHQEHLYSETVQALLRTAIDALPSPLRRPRVLLTTLPNEQHGLGLLMVHALYRHNRVDALSLGTQTPRDDIVKAVQLHAADAVALSFSAAFSHRTAQREVSALRKALPGNVELWIGGAGTRRLPLGTRGGCTLGEALDLPRSWRLEHGT